MTPLYCKSKRGANVRNVLKCGYTKKITGDIVCSLNRIELILPPLPVLSDQAKENFAFLPFHWCAHKNIFRKKYYTYVCI